MLKIEYILVENLRAYARNARTHSDEQIQQIINSINAFGFTNPVLIDEDNELIAGHGRTEAAKMLGLDEIPAIRLTNLDDDQKRALRISDNQLALNAGWDLDMLAGEIADLQIEGFDLELLAFDDEFLNGLLVNEADVEDEMPELPSGERAPFQNKTFVLHDDQIVTVDDALLLAKTNPMANMGLNENSNGNALALICKEWLEAQNGDR